MDYYDSTGTLVGTEILEPTTPEDPRWHAMRATGVGASDAGALMGEAYKGRNAYSVWLEKVHPDQVPPYDDSTLLLFERGHQLEPLVAQVYQDKHPGRHLQTVGLARSTSNPYLLATPDRLVDEDGGLEIKTAGQYGFMELDPDDFPRLWYWQCVQLLRVTGRQWWDLIALHPDSWQHMEWRLHADDPQVQADMNLIDAVVLDFWESYVLTGMAPEVDITDSDTLLQVHPVPEGAVEVDDEDVPTMLHMVERYQELTAQIKELQDEKDLVAETLKLTAGSADVVAAQGQFLYRYSASSSTRVDTKGLERDHPDIYAEYVSKRPQRRLAFTPKKSPKK